MKEKINPRHPRHPRLKNHAVSVSMTKDEGGRRKGEPLFCAKDVAEALGYDQPRKAVERHVERDDGMKRTLIDSMVENKG